LQNLKGKGCGSAFADVENGDLAHKLCKILHAESKNLANIPLLVDPTFAHFGANGIRTFL